MTETPSTPAPLDSPDNTASVGAGWSLDAGGADEPYIGTTLEGEARRVDGGSDPSPEQPPREPSSVEDVMKGINADAEADGTEHADPDGYDDEDGSSNGDGYDTQGPAPLPDIEIPGSPAASKASNQRSGTRSRGAKLAGLGVMAVAIVVGAGVYRHSQQNRQSDLVAGSTLPTPPVPAHPAPVAPAPLPGSTPTLSPVAAAPASSNGPATTSQLHDVTLAPAHEPALPPELSSAPSPAPVSHSADDFRMQASIDDLKRQLGVLQSQMAVLRKQARTPRKAPPSQRTDHKLRDLADHVDQVNVRLSHLGDGDAHGVSHDVLHGFKLLAVTGGQAVVEDLASGHTRVLSVNDRFGDLVIYQITRGQVVTNYGVF